MAIDFTVSVVDEKDATVVADEITQHLLSALSADNLQSTNTSMTFAVRNTDQTMIAGLSMSTSYGWVLIKTLWVAEENRRCGIGRKLMRHALAHGRKLGCHGVWLDTSSAVARDFYSGLGFTVFAELANAENNFPPTHRRWFMKIQL